MPRNFDETIDSILLFIPTEGEDAYSELHQELKSMRGAWYKAAEIEGPALWMGAANTLEEWLEEPSKDWSEWKWQVLSLFTGVPFTA